MKSYAYPDKGKAVRALLIAPLLPVGILFLMDAIDRSLRNGPLSIIGAALLAFYVGIVVELFSLILGGITLALLWKRVPFHLLICAVAGGVVAALPFVLSDLFPSGKPISYNAWVDGRATVVDGIKTPYGRWRDFIFLLLCFGLGFLGGGFFWWLCRPGLKKGSSAQ